MAAELNGAERYGDEQAGYSISMDASANAVRVQAWGFWGPELASKFGELVGAMCRSKLGSGTLIMDMSRLKPMREEGQVSFGKLIQRLVDMRASNVTIITQSPLTKLQLLRLVTDHGGKTLVRFE